MNKERQLIGKVVRLKTIEKHKILFHSHFYGDYVRHHDGGGGDHYDGYDDARDEDARDENWDSFMKIL